MEQFRQGTVRVLVCTDAAGTGCNISDIQFVVQWKVPESLESFQQRAGRVARNKLLTGIAILLVEQNAYRIDPTKPAIPDSPRNGKPSRGASKRDKKKKKKKVTGDEAVALSEIEVHDNSPGGGIYALVQTSACRRAVILKAFENPTTRAPLTVRCCDCCDSSLLSECEPPPHTTKTRPKRSRGKGEVNGVLQSDLIAWREEICDRDYSHVLWAPDAFLDDDTIDSIARCSDAGNETRLAAILENRWSFWAEYSRELLARIQQTLPQSTTITQASTQRTGQMPEPTVSKAGESTRNGLASIKPRNKRAATTSQSEAPMPPLRRRKIETGPGRLHSKANDDSTPSLVRVPPAPLHLQWGVSPVRVPPGMTPVVPSQK